MRVLVVTNDFPPRIGGIESFVAAACGFLDDDVVVLTSTAPGSAHGDAEAPYPIERLPGPLLPTPAVGRAAVALMRRHRADRVLFGAAAPLALLAPTLRAAGARRIVALTHGHETWWATLPGSRRLLRRIGDEVDVLTTISDHVAARVAAALSPAGRAKLVRLPPPVDLDLFAPANRGPAGLRLPSSDGNRDASRLAGLRLRSSDGNRDVSGLAGLRLRSSDGNRDVSGLAGLRLPSSDGERDTRGPAEQRMPSSDGKRSARRAIAVGRMVPRKGFDTLLRAWSLLEGAERAPLTGTPPTGTPPTGTTPTGTTPTGTWTSAQPPYELVLVGDGPERGRLERQASRAGLTEVRFTGALDQNGVRDQLQQADVFAFPVRTRLGGLDPEGLGLAPIEAAACGLPVIVGRSGGAPETVRHGRTGYLIQPDDPYELAGRLLQLLDDPALAARLGAAGRTHVAERFGADRARRVLRTALGLADPDRPSLATV